MKAAQQRERGQRNQTSLEKIAAFDGLGLTSGGLSLTRSPSLFRFRASESRVRLGTASGTPLGGGETCLDVPKVAEEVGGGRAPRGPPTKGYKCQNFADIRSSFKMKRRETGATAQPQAPFYRLLWRLREAEQRLEVTRAGGHLRRSSTPPRQKDPIKRRNKHRLSPQRDREGTDESADICC